MKLSDNRKKVVVGDYTSAILGVSYYSTPYDLYLWEKALWNNELFSEKSRKKALTKHKQAAKIENNGPYKRSYFDLGFVVDGIDGNYSQVVHDGSNPDHHALKGKDFDKDLIVIMMSSDGRKTTLFEIINFLWPKPK